MKNLYKFLTSFLPPLAAMGIVFILFLIAYDVVTYPIRKRDRDKVPIWKKKKIPIPKLIKYIVVFYIPTFMFIVNTIVNKYYPTISYRTINWLVTFIMIFPVINGRKNPQYDPFHGVELDLTFPLIENAIKKVKYFRVGILGVWLDNKYFPYRKLFALVPLDKQNDICYLFLDDNEKQYLVAATSRQFTRLKPIWRYPI